MSCVFLSLENIHKRKWNEPNRCKAFQLITRDLHLKRYVTIASRFSIEWHFVSVRIRVFSFFCRFHFHISCDHSCVSIYICKKTSIWKCWRATFGWWRRKIVHAFGRRYKQFTFDVIYAHRHTHFHIIKAYKTRKCIYIFLSGDEWMSFVVENFSSLFVSCSLWDFMQMTTSDDVQSESIIISILYGRGHLWKRTYVHTQERMVYKEEYRCHCTIYGTKNPEDQVLLEWCWCFFNYHRCHRRKRPFAFMSRQITAHLHRFHSFESDRQNESWKA